MDVHYLAVAVHAYETALLHRSARGIAKTSAECSVVRANAVVDKESFCPQAVCHYNFLASSPPPTLFLGASPVSALFE
jgi:hypothetical protein